MMQKNWKWLKAWHVGTHRRVLSDSFPINTNMTRFRCIQKSLHPCSLDKSSLSIGRVKMCFLGKLWGSLVQIVYLASHISGKCYLLYFINGRFVISFHLISNKTLHISPFLFIYWHVINILWCQLYQFMNSIWHFFCNFKLLKSFSFFYRIFS